MKLFILFTLFSVIAAMARLAPSRTTPIIVGAPTVKDPKQYEVMTAIVEHFAGDRTNLKVLFGESTCTNTDSVLAINSANCELIPGGKRSIWIITDLYRPWKAVQHVITATKIEDVKPDELSTSTVSSGDIVYADSDSAALSKKKRHTEDSNRIQNWH